MSKRLYRNPRLQVQQHILELTLRTAGFGQERTIEFGKSRSTAHLYVDQLRNISDRKLRDELLARGGWEFTLKFGINF